MNVYTVATTTKPEVICPPWCDWTPDQHVADLDDWEGHAVHTGFYPFTWQGPFGGGLKEFTVNVGQTLLPEGIANPQERDEDRNGDITVAVEGRELTPVQALAFAQHLIEVATAAAEGRVPTVPSHQEPTS